VISKPVSDYKLLNEKIYEYADKGDFVTLFIKGAISGDADIVKHGNIKKINLGKSFFNLKTFIRVIMKKKRFDKVYMDDKGLAKVLAGTVINE
jgi:hypothetical protein